MEGLAQSEECWTPEWDGVASNPRAGPILEVLIIKYCEK